MKECEGSTSSLTFPEFAWKGFSWFTDAKSRREASLSLVEICWNHWTLGVAPRAPMPMPRVRLELGVFLRLIFQNTSKYMKAKVKSLASSHIFHLTKWCKATCNICSLAAWCMGANYLRWVARMNKLSICASSRNDLAFLSFLRTQYLYRVGGNALGTLAYLHYSSLYIPPYAVPPFKNMFPKFLTSSGDSTAAAILKQVRTRPELRLLIVPGISLSTVDAKVTASQHHNRGQAQFIGVKCESLSKGFVMLSKHLPITKKTFARATQHRQCRWSKRDESNHARGQGDLGRRGVPQMGSTS